MSKSFTGTQLAEALHAGSLKEPIVRFGMVKVDASAPGSVLFAESGCESWLEIPVDLIEEAEHLTTISCRDHTHPVVKIRFKEAPADNALARIFAKLLRQRAARPVPGALSSFGGLQNAVLPVRSSISQGPKAPTMTGGHVTPDQRPGGGSGLPPCTQEGIECHPVTYHYGGYNITIIECNLVCTDRAGA